MAQPDDLHLARGEALAAVRPLVAAEESRSANLNSRALGVISAGSVVTAIGAFFAKDLLTGTSLDKLGASKAAAIDLLIAAVVLLGATVLYGVFTLWPRTRSFIEPDGIKAWSTAEGQTGMSESRIRQQTLTDLAGYLIKLREFNAEKVERLQATYVLYALAVSAIAVDAVLFFVGAL